MRRRRRATSSRRRRQTAESDRAGFCAASTGASRLLEPRRRGPCSNGCRWIAGHDDVWRHAPRDDRAGANDRTVSNRDASKDDGISANPHVAANVDAAECLSGALDAIGGVDTVMRRHNDDVRSEDRPRAYSYAAGPVDVAGEVDRDVGLENDAGDRAESIDDEAARVVDPNTIVQLDSDRARAFAAPHDNTCADNHARADEVCGVAQLPIEVRAMRGGNAQRVGELNGRGRQRVADFVPQPAAEEINHGRTRPAPASWTIRRPRR